MLSRARAAIAAGDLVSAFELAKIRSRASGAMRAGSRTMN